MHCGRSYSIRNGTSGVKTRSRGLKYSHFCFFSEFRSANSGTVP